MELGPGTKDITQPRKLRELEGALLKLPGVQSARVSGTDQPTEIHIVTGSTQPVKRIVRDVESLALASFGFKIDFRIVSVVRVDDGPTPSRFRPWIEKVGVSKHDSSEWVEVSIRWPQEEAVTGTGVAGQSREARARGATTAVIECLDKKLSAAQMTVEVDHLMIQRIAEGEWVLVHAVMYEKGSSTQLVGTAPLMDDVASAAARALLDAINRKLPS